MEVNTFFYHVVLLLATGAWQLLSLFIKASSLLTARRRTTTTTITVRHTAITRSLNLISPDYLEPARSPFNLTMRRREQVPSNMEPWRRHRAVAEAQARLEQERQQRRTFPVEAALVANVVLGEWPKVAALLSLVNRCVGERAAGERGEVTLAQALERATALAEPLCSMQAVRDEGAVQPSGRHLLQRLFQQRVLPGGSSWRAEGVAL